METDGNEKTEQLQFLKRLEGEQWEACLALDGKAASAFDKYLIWDAFLGFHPMTVTTGLGEHRIGAFRLESASTAPLSCSNPQHDEAAIGFRHLSFDLWKTEERERDQRRKLEEERAELDLFGLTMAF
jgi:hypothetical protein